MKEKRFIIRKYVMATNCQQALKKEKKTRPDDCWVDEEWKKDNQKDLVSAIGFTVNNYDD
jgi:hypothetical protein